MCGIAGFTRFTSHARNEETLMAMGQAIFHRGPDAGGQYLDDGVGLCHRRLSIIDLSEAGNQPMHSLDGRSIIVFNGEIYNFQELRQDLIRDGYNFRSKTDTEVLLALYQREGQQLVKKINGMFSFAIWDKVKQELFLARDRLGKKPLYYFWDGRDFVFGSEIKAILEMPGIEREIRPDALYDFFAYQYVPDPKTIFKNIYKLKPGHTITVNTDGVSCHQYWDLSFLIQRNKEKEVLAQDLYDYIDASVKSRMVSDVPLGAFLSGGVDSSGVVGLMAKNASSPVTTCTIGFSSQEFDEVDFAREIARKFNTDHHEFTVRETVSDNLERIASYFDEPFADPSLVPTYFVSQLARKKVTVALAGDGGDENFAGYSKYVIDAMENRIRSIIPGFIRSSVFVVAERILRGRNSRLLRRGHTLVSSLIRDPAYGFYLTNSFFRQQVWDELVKEDYKSALSGYHPSTITADYYNNAPATDHLSRVLYTDFKTYLSGDILVKVDRMSMANSLEVRAPLLDYKVVEFAASIPSRLKLKGKDKKYILKLAFSRLLSKDTLYRKKMGFSVPLAQWLRSELRPYAERVLFESKGGLSDYFHEDRLRSLWKDHQSGAMDYGNELWSMLMFQLWYNRYMV